MRNNQEAEQLRELLFELGRRRPLRDPLTFSLGELELTPPQIHTLVWLGHEGALTMGDLGRRVGCSMKNMTGVADRLERDGYCRRARDEDDRRVVRLSLTRKGEATFRAIQERVTAKLRWLVSVLDREDRAALFRIIHRLLELDPPVPAAANASKERKR